MSEPLTSHDIGTTHCESWAHVVVDGSPVPAVPGRITCSAHADEEDEYRRVLGELARVEDAIARFERRREGRHQKKAEDLIEDAVREFFRPIMTDRRLSTSSAYQYQGAVERQYDIAVSVDPDAPGSWNASATVRELREGERVGAHIEVSYRAKSKVRRTASDATVKMDRDVAKLLATIDAAIINKHDALPWTALVLLGDGWPGAEAIMSRFHERHRVDGVRRPTLGDQPSWAMLDAIVAPGAFFKKHDVFWQEDPKALWPAYQHFAVAPDSVARGLAIARVFLAHRLDVRLEFKATDSDAFGYASDLATWGPVSRAVPVAVNSMSAFLMRDVRDARHLFGFEGWSQEYGLHAVLLGGLDPSLASSIGLPFRVRFGL